MFTFHHDLSKHSPSANTYIFQIIISPCLAVLFLAQGASKEGKLLAQEEIVCILEEWTVFFVFCFFEPCKFTGLIENFQQLNPMYMSSCSYLFSYPISYFDPWIFVYCIVFFF